MSKWYRRLVLNSTQEEGYLSFEKTQREMCRKKKEVILIDTELNGTPIKTKNN